MTVAESYDYLMATPRPTHTPDGLVDLRSIPYFMAYYYLACELLAVEL